MKSVLPVLAVLMFFLTGSYVYAQDVVKLVTGVYDKVEENSDDEVEHAHDMPGGSEEKTDTDVYDPDVPEVYLFEPDDSRRLSEEALPPGEDVSTDIGVGTDG